MAPALNLEKKRLHWFPLGAFVSSLFLLCLFPRPTHVVSLWMHLIPFCLLFSCSLFWIFSSSFHIFGYQCRQMVIGDGAGRLWRCLYIQYEILLPYVMAKGGCQLVINGDSPSEQSQMMGLVDCGCGSSYNTKYYCHKWW